jgi:Family of unknown function (DUF6346)
VRSKGIRALVWCLAFVLGLLTFATVSRVTYGGDPEADRLGVATVDSCAEYGPLGVYGFGTTYRCTAEVRWSDGRVEQREFAPGQLSPSERDVPVYLDNPDGRGTTYLGRNDSARFSALSLPATLAIGFAVIALGIGAIYTAYRVFRPQPGPRRSGPVHTRAGQQRLAGRRIAREWPISDADRVAAPTPKIVVRMRLLSAWCALVVLLVPLSTIPRFDAPRALRFVSPWPQIERAFLVDLPAPAAVILGLILAVLFFAMAGGARVDAARVVRYGADYLARDLQGKGSAEKKVREHLGRLEARERTHRTVEVVFGSGLVALTVWAAFRAFTVGGGPVTVWLSCFTETFLLAFLAGIWLGTIEPPYRRFERLLRQDHAGIFPAKGTNPRVLPS